MTRLLALSSILSAACLVACGTTPPDSHDPELALDLDTPTRIAGDFTRDGTTLRFDFTREGTQLHAVISAADGTDLIDSTIADDGSHVTSLLGGRLLVEGSPTTAPTYTGDRGAMAAIDAMPEGARLSELEPLLAAHEVEPTLLPRMAGAHADRSVGTIRCNSVAVPVQSVSCGTVFFGATSMGVVNYDTIPIQVQVYGPAFYYATPIVAGYGHAYDLTGWWWGGNVLVTNTGVCPAGYCGPYGLYDDNARLWVY